MRLTRDFEDGLTRCGWLNDDLLYRQYHDTEWGVRTEGQNQLFEVISLEGFQAGLSWLTILKRREGFRRAFLDFEIEKVAAITSDRVEELMLDDSIIRNRAKINSTISNARLIIEKGIDLTSLLWSFAPSAPVNGESVFEWRATSPESDAMSKELKRLGFSFVGSTTMYALMQSTGMIQDHAPGCFRRP
jgi:DNA-3-methyladenine glycosylase I